MCHTISHSHTLLAKFSVEEPVAALQLFLADVNRVTSETPMNLATSRSHCLFTTTIEARQVGVLTPDCLAQQRVTRCWCWVSMSKLFAGNMRAGRTAKGLLLVAEAVSAWVLQEGSDLVRKAKLNLVDLAGSERVSRTNSDGVLLKEAKYINLSLHYLEQVIIALQV
jgi:kinesin family member 6/9